MEKLKELFSKIKDLLIRLMSFLPRLEQVIKLAPFFMGILAGYILRTPIGWLLSIIRVLLRL